MDVPELSYFMKPILIAPEGMTMISGDAGGGKTRLCLSMARALGAGEAMIDWPVPEPVRVLYVDAELGASLMKKWLSRLTPLPANFGIISNQVNYRRARATGAEYKEVTLATEVGRDYITSKIEQWKAQVVFLDSLFTLVPPEVVDGKASETSWPTVLRWMLEQKMKGVHIVLLHHNNRGGKQYGSILKEIHFDYRGSIKQRTDYTDADAGIWGFEFTSEKPRDMSAEEAKPKILQLPDEGPMIYEIIEGVDPSIKRDDQKTQERNSQIIQLHKDGVPQTTIAEQCDCSRETVRKVLNAARRSSLV